MNGFMDAALTTRGDGGACSARRLPTARYPVMSTTLHGTFDAAGNATLEYLADRDTLWTTMSVLAGNARVSMEHCNTKYLRDSHAFVWGVCCARKPIFLVGVRENKRLTFLLSGGMPAAEASITLAGFQGNGCAG